MIVIIMSVCNNRMPESHCHPSLPTYKAPRALNLYNIYIEIAFSIIGNDSSIRHLVNNQTLAQPLNVWLFY